MLLAGDIPFETKGEYRVETNRFCAFLREEDGELSDLTAFAGVDGDYAEMFRAGTMEIPGGVFRIREAPCSRETPCISAWSKMKNEIPFLSRSAWQN